MRSFNFKSNNSQSGFTLLEVLISMAVLVFISFAIYQATVETFKLRDTLAQEGDFYTGIRLSTTILERDLTMMFSPTIAIQPSPSTTPGNGLVPGQGQVQGQGYPTPQKTFQPIPGVSGNDDLNQSFPFWSSGLKDDGTRPSHFIGTENKLTFISLSHVRIYKDAPESEFAKITFELKRDEKNKDNPDTQVLVKTENPDAFGEDDRRTKMSHSYELLHGIKKLSYTYYQREPGGNTWKTTRSWDTDKEDTRNIYPDVIELKIEVLGPKSQTFEGTFKIRPEMPLNGLNASM